MGEDLGPKLKRPHPNFVSPPNPISPSHSVDTGAGLGDRKTSEMLHNVMEPVLDELKDSAYT